MSPDAIASELMLKELRRIREALESQGVERVTLTYEQAAKALGCSKRSVERLVSLGRLKPRDIGGPKIPASQLRELADGDMPRGRRKPRASGDMHTEAKTTMAAVRELVRKSQQGGRSES